MAHNITSLCHIATFFFSVPWAEWAFACHLWFLLWNVPIKCTLHNFTNLLSLKDNKLFVFLIAFACSISGDSFNYISKTHPSLSLQNRQFHSNILLNIQFPLLYSTFLLKFTLSWDTCLHSLYFYVPTMCSLH